MPSPFFGGGPGEQWFGELQAWNEDRREPFYKHPPLVGPGRAPVPDYEAMGIGGTPEEMDAIQRILAAMLGDSGMSDYRIALDKLRQKRKSGPKAPQPPPAPTPLGDLDRGVQEVSGTETREEALKRKQRELGI